MDYRNQSLSYDEIIDIGVQMSQGDGPFPRNDMEEKEREVVHSNRVKLTDYIHDPTVLFPYMKESDVFSVFDCETIKGEGIPHNKVDKFIDVLLTKGPKAIGVFHEALGKTYPGLFDYFTRLFNSKGIDLPESRRMRPASKVDHSEMTQDESVGSRYSIYDMQDDIPWKNQMKVLSRRGMTVRRSLDLLSKQLETIQTERNELKNTLSDKEKEISGLLKSKEKNHDDLLSITQHYQNLSRELLQLRETLSIGGSQKVQIEKMANERESIQAEYDALENDYTLVQLELRAARERISRLMGHLERSETLVAFAQEERDAIQHKCNQMEGQLQREERKVIRIRTEGTGGRSEIDALHKQLEKFQKELEQSRNESVELSERLKVARHERSEAIDEKDDIVKRMYLEEQTRKKAEIELKQLRKQLKDPDNNSSDGSFVSYPLSNSTEVMIEMEDFTTVMQASDNMGMNLGLGVIITNVTQGGLACKSGLKSGDQLFQVNHIDVTSDRDPLDLCYRLLQNASNLVSLLIRRPVITNQLPNSNNVGQVQTMPSRIRQIPVPNDGPIKSSTIDRFRLPLTWSDSPNSSHISTTPSSSFVTSPSMDKVFGGVAASLGFQAFPSSVSMTADTLKSDHGRSNFHETFGSLPQEVHLRRIHTNTRNISSDDGHSSRTSSSEERNSYLSDRLLMHSPTHNCGFMYYDDVPPSVTRPPTLVGDDFEDTMEIENEYPTARDDMHLNLNSYNNGPPQFHHLCSSPASYTPTPILDSPQSLRRQKAKKWHHGQRRSQSLVDMPDNMFESVQDELFNKEEIQMLKMRRIVLPWGKLGDDISILGGRGRGIFFNTQRIDSKGLKSGDQLIKIGSIVVGRMTYADVVLTIQDYCQKGEQCMITVHSNMEDFTKLSSLDCRDDFYVRACFSYKQQISPGELLFSNGDVFHVKDTMPNGKKEVWRVNRVNSFGQEQEEGNIPLVHKISNWMASMPNSSSLPNKFRLPFSGKRHGSATGTDNYDIVPGRTIFDWYQPVKRIESHYPRPVVILGICDSEVRQSLLIEASFSLPPICTSDSLAMVEDQCSTGNIILKRTGENIRYCKVADVESISQEEQHCLLPIEPSQLKNTSLIKLHPIVLLLFTQKPNHLSKMKAFKTCPEVVQKYLAEMKSLEDDYSSHFTCRVEISGQLENVVKQVRTEIDYQEKIALWQDDDDTTMDYRMTYM